MLLLQWIWVLNFKLYHQCGLSYDIFPVTPKYPASLPIHPNKEQTKKSERMATRICDILDYETDIAPYPFVMLYSGVGSGKSYFAGKMITGDKKSKIPPQNILIITSRRAKVEETLKEMGVLITDRLTQNGNLDFEVWQTGEYRPPEYEKYLKEIKGNSEWGDFSFLSYNKSAVCTNAYISAYLRYVYNPEEPLTHIWNKFDAIIIDEVHSLVTDSTYQTAGFDVQSFIEEYVKLQKEGKLLDCACKHLILMTGTPQPFETATEYIDFPKDKTNILRWFDRCENVVPKNIILIDKQTTKAKIMKLLSSGEKIIYFTNHTLTESGAREKFDLSDDVNIGVSFSNDDKRKKLSPEEQKRIQEVDESLSKSLIPDNVHFFVTTSRNKEGININNTDYHNMFVETHLLYDIVQMAGRIRSGIENLYIITDTEQFYYDGNLIDILFSKKIMVANSDISNSDDEANKYLVNEYLSNEKWLDKKYEERKKKLLYYIKYIEERFSYVRYNVFRQRFEYFRIKESAEIITNNYIDKFKAILLEDMPKIEQFLKEWFPDVSVKREETAEAYCKNYLFSLIGKKPFITLNKDEVKTLVSVIAERFGVDIKSYKKALEMVDEKFQYRRKTDKEVILFYGTEEPRTKRKPMRKARKR